MSEEIVIYGNSVGPALPKSDLRETDPKKGSYVLGRELLITTVNGNGPDENGNVEVKIPDGGNSTPGKDGGYYVPTVEQVSETEAEVSFVPSDSNMPVIPKVSLKLPVGPPGDPGKNGGFYVPNVEQVATDTIRMSFTATGNENMPVQQPVVLKLPQGPRGDSYILTDADKSEITRLVIESLGGNPIFGYVDANNNIVVSGHLGDGRYSVKYEMEDGSLLPIGDLEIDNTIEYSVACNLTNCINTNGAVEIAQGASYTATITPNSGYALQSVSVTMGGTDITASAVNGGNISIAEVTGDIVITAVAEKTTVTPSYTNLLPLSVDTDGSLYNGGKGYKSGYRLSKSANGGEVAQDGMCCSGFMPIVATTDTVRIKNITWHATSGWNLIFFYNSTKAYIGATYFSTDMLSGDIYTFKPSAIGSFVGAAFFRFAVGEISDETVVTVNQEIV